MPIYKEGAMKDKEEEPKEKTVSGSFSDFIKKESTKQFISEWHEKGYTKAGVEELLYELHARYCSGGGDDDDEDKEEEHVIKRAGEMLDVMKSVRGLFEPFKDRTEG
jgi:hypothetical protein